MTNDHSFPLSENENVFVLPSLLKEIFTGCRSLGDMMMVVSLGASKMLFHCLPLSSVLHCS